MAGDLRQTGPLPIDRPVAQGRRDAIIRTATQTPLPGPIVRLSIGLEDVGDLIADLDAGLARYQAQFTA